MVYRPLPVDIVPEVILTRWLVFEVSSPHWEGRSRHFVGHNVNDGDGRVSSEIKQFDKEKMIGITRSGRAYHLKGEPAANIDALYVWDVWCNDCKAFDIKDVSNEYESV